MRISDWSSDVCSSDLQRVDPQGPFDVRIVHRAQDAVEPDRRIVDEPIYLAVSTGDRLHQAVNAVDVRHVERMESQGLRILLEEHPEGLRHGSAGGDNAVAEIGRAFV